MKKFNFIVICVLGLMLIIGISCSLITNPSEDGSSNEKAEPDLKSKEWAMAVAMEVLKDMLVYNSNWTTESKITGAFPVYLLGISEAPSYYECKVTTNDQNAGYILVNIDQKDIVIPEAAHEGLTLTEQYRQKLKRKDFRVCRLDWFSSVAIANSGGKSGDSTLASLGLIDESGEIRLNSQAKSANSENIQENLDTFISSVSAEGCFPGYTKDELNNYYQNQPTGFGSKAKYSTTVRFLQHQFNNGHYLPSWYQPDNSQGKPVGCAATAYAMAYAYWKQFKGKNRLFNGIDISRKYNYTDCNSGEIYKAMWEIHDDLGTLNINSSGLTLPGSMDRGNRYGESYGYPTTVAMRSSKLGLRKNDLINHVLGEIDQDRPVVLLINASGYGIPNHYVTASAATKTLKNNIFGTVYDNIAYYVNFGWSSGVRKWIYHMGGTNRYSIFESYTPNVMGDVLTPTPLKPTPGPFDARINGPMTINEGDQNKSFTWKAQVFNPTGSVTYSWKLTANNCSGALLSFQRASTSSVTWTVPNYPGAKDWKITLVVTNNGRSVTKTMKLYVYYNQSYNPCSGNVY